MNIFVVNLLPWRQRRQMRLTRCWWRLLLLLAGGLLLAMMLGKGAIIRQRMAQEATLTMRESEYQQQRAQLQAVQKAMTQLARYAQWQRANDAARAHNLRYAQLLEQLAVLVPAGLWLTTLAEKEGVISISGLSYGYGDIVQLRARLESESALTAVRIMHARHDSVLPANARRDLPLAFLLQAAWPSASQNTSGNDPQ